KAAKQPKKIERGGRVMDQNTIMKLLDSFNAISRRTPDESVEFWFARDLMEALGYTKWQNFVEVIAKGKAACANTGVPVENHFTDVSKMVTIGSGSEREIEDIMLTRYACYLIAQNGDPRKEAIAFAQTYFAVQTRKQELIEERLRLHERLQARQKLTESETELSRNIYERGVDDQGFGRIRSKGDAALFGGHTTAQMKEKLGMPTARPLADFLPTVTIAAKNLATEITNYNVRQKDLQGEPAITSEHVQNNTSVRTMLGERGIKPEELPPEEDIKKLERRVKSAEKKLIKESGLLGRGKK
ncbi:DNA damage-inducible protein D, partial [Desulfosarcina sp. OttesenSCG-928-G10]|nr:DNA damage-inducible protein D [Desulfosarcina sp. OttesenSCG-928-G10]